MRTRTVALGIITAALFLAAACSGKKSTPVSPYESAGPYPVGHSRFLVIDSARGRALTTEIWYPADESARAAADAGEPAEDFLPAGADHDAFVALLSTAANPGTRRLTHAVRDAAPATAPATWPFVVLSHCHDCLNFGYSTIAERLASHGIAVLAPDHANNTLFDLLAGTAVGIDDAFLGVRAGDVSSVLDNVLSLTTSAVPAALSGRLDAAHAGVIGHSFGAATVGRVLQDDARFKAGAAIAAPIANPLFPSVTLASIQQPVLMMLATEDNSIGTVGNGFIRSNFQQKSAPVWLVSFTDAGHWSFSDICGLIPEFGAGCINPATRQTNGAPFDYVDVDLARNTAASYATEFFALELLGDPSAKEALSRSKGIAKAESR